jgi:hypothetical protein
VPSEIFWIWIHVVLLAVNIWMLTLPTYPHVKWINGLCAGHETFWLGWNLHAILLRL